MITLFATARSFSGHMGLIQCNAIRSWLALCPPCEILLLGNDEGTSEIAREYRIGHIPDVGCNEFGTPLISSLFGAAQKAAKHEVLCQINADIMLTDDFLPAVKRALASKRKFLMSGQRWDVDMEKSWDFDQPDWPGRLREYVHRHGSLHPATGLDYFVFVKGTLGVIPPFAIGRRVLDNWLIYRARSLALPVVDATSVITAVHQNHGYAFYPAGPSAVMEGPEVQRNLQLAGGEAFVFTLEDATHVLTAAGTKRIITLERMRRHFNALAVTHPRLAPWVRLTSGPVRIARSLGLWPPTNREPG